MGQPLCDCANVFHFGECLRPTMIPSREDGRRQSARLLLEVSRQISAVAHRGREGFDRGPFAGCGLVVKKQLGECNRQMGDYKEAIAMFTAVLQAKEAELSVQRSAALLTKAGARPTIRNGLRTRFRAATRIARPARIGFGVGYGWRSVAERTSRTNPQYRDMFYEARLESARCRFLAAAKAERRRDESNSSTSPSKAFARCCRSIRI